MQGLFKKILLTYFFKQSDLVYVFMWGTPFGSSFYERLLRILSHKVIYDIEDNVLMEQTSSLNPLTRFLRGQGKTRYLIKKLIMSLPALLF